VEDEPLDIEVLRAEIARAARIDDPAERALEIVAVIESLAAPLGIHPVVVGGMAVYFWTASEKFLTHDIDVVMETPDILARRLGELGFVRAANRRHWTLPGTDIYLEAPSSHLDANATVTEIELASGRSARVLSRVDILLDRLDEFQATGHETPAQQALFLLTGLSLEQAQALDRRAPEREVAEILQAIREIADDLAAGGEPPDSGELHEIARAALRAKYPSE
jgi:hypothetical protein